MTDEAQTPNNEAATSKINTVKHEMTVKLDSTPIIEDAVRAWGGALQNSRGAPSWSRIEGFIKDINQENAKLTVITDTAAAGSLAFEFSKKQKEYFDEARELLEALAKRIGASDDAIDTAKKAYDSSISNAQITETFTAELGSVAVGAFLEKTASQSPVITHERFGELDAKSLSSLSKIKAPTPLEGAPDSDDAIAAQMPRPVPKSDMSKYQSMGQMVKASDAAALTEYIEWSKKEKNWDESKIDACSKLCWVAAGGGSIETVRVLLEKGGADIDFADNTGITPLLAAVANNHPDMIEFLIKNGANKKATPMDGRSAIMLAAAHDAVDSIKKLHQLGFDINERSLEGRTPLHHAALGEDESTAVNSIKTLIELGANPTIVDDIGDEGGCLAEQYVDEEHDESYALLTQFRKDWEAGKTGPQTTVSTAISKARSVLGF